MSTGASGVGRSDGPYWIYGLHAVRAAIGADGVATAFASAFGGSPTTTYAENIGVMGATRVYSSAAYYVAAAVAILLGLCPKFGAVVNATPGGVLGGITVLTGLHPLIVAAHFLLPDNGYVLIHFRGYLVEMSGEFGYEVR